MKKIYLSFLASCFTMMGLMAQTSTSSKVTFDPISASGKCDGSATFHPGSITSWEWFHDSTLVQTNGDILDSLCEGNYAVMYMDSAGTTQKKDTFFIGLAQAPPPTGGTNPGSNVTVTGVSDSSQCDGSATFNAGSVSTWKWFKDSTLIQTDGTSINNLCEGYYSVQFMDSAGTSVIEDKFHIAIVGGSSPPPTGGPNPGSKVTFTSVSDSSKCDGTATFNAGSLTTWKWFKDATLIQTDGTTISNLCEGAYSVQFLDSAGTSTIEEKFYLGFNSGTNPPPSGGGSSSGSGTCPGFEAHGVATNSTSTTAGSCDGTAEIVVTKGGIAPFMYLWDNSSITTNKRSGICAGAYGFTVTDSAGCSYTDTIHVENVNPSNPCGNMNVNILPTGESVPGACDGKAEVFVDGAVAPFTYDWTNSNVNTKVYGNLCSGHYTVKVTDGNNCVAEGAVDIQANGVNSKPCEFFRVHTFVINDSSHASTSGCGGYVEATCKGFQGSLSYSWADNSSNTTAFRHNACEGDYTVTVSDSAGCSASISTHVGMNHPPVTTAPAPGIEPLHIFVKTRDVTNAASCNGMARAKIVGGTPPYTATFGTKSGTGDYFETDSLCAGFYTIDVIDADSSTTSFVFVIGSPATTFTPPTPPFVNPVVKDTLVANAIATCDIDYDAIDSIRITSHDLVGSDSVKCLWTIFQAGGNKDITQHYQLSGTGIFNFILDLFCTNRASGSAKAEDMIDLTATGIDEVVNSVSTIYPNPFGDQLKIDLNSNSTVTIIDVTGRTVYTSVLNAGTSTINTDELNSGMYFISVSDGQNITSRKLIKR